MRPLLLALLLSSLALPASAEVFVARNGLRVHATPDPAVMAVVAQPGSAGPQFFCAAGDYARGPLRAGAGDRLVVVEPVRRDPAFRNQRTLRVAVVPQGIAVPPRTGLLVDPNRPGENLSVSHAQFLCERGGRGFRFTSRLH